MFIGLTKGQTEITYRTIAFLENYGNLEKYVTPTTVFKVYYTIMTQGSPVMMTQPKWATFIGQHLLMFLER